jgi:signal transduction histidine kinase
MTHFRQKWDELYEAAVFELNPTKLLVRIDLARSAIKSRLKELNSQDGNTNEKRRLVNAARTLEMLLKIEGTTGNQNSVTVRTL